MKTINVKIKGMLPLLQHKMPLATEAQLASTVKKSKGQSKLDDPEDFLYKHDGVIVQPAEHIYQGLLKTLSGYKIQGKGKKTYKDMGKGYITVMPEYIPHIHQEWVPDERTVVIGATRGRIVRIRPKFNNWELEFQLLLRSDELPVDVVQAALQDVGMSVGLGDYRPRFGLFTVTEFKEIV